MLDVLKGTPPLHIRARGAHPLYKPRAQVADDKCSWEMAWDSYDPVQHTAQVVLDNDRTVVPDEEKPKKGWADPDLPVDDDGTPCPFDDEFVAELRGRESHEQPMASALFDEFNRPKNPRGRTGMVGRGQLGKWGCNLAADPIVTRFEPNANPDRKRLQMVAIQRRDTKEWALPGGMVVRPGQQVSALVREKFEKEATDKGFTARERVKNQKLLEELFSNGQHVYAGYVDDPRNTDNAWMETTALHFHCNDECARFLQLRAGDNAQGVQWIDIDQTSDTYIGLYASHRDWVDQVARVMLPHQKCRMNALLPFAYPTRVHVDDDHVQWSDKWPEYAPERYSARYPTRRRSLENLKGSKQTQSFGESRAFDKLGKQPPVGSSSNRQRSRQSSSSPSRSSSTASQGSKRERRPVSQPSDATCSHLHQQLAEAEAASALSSEAGMGAAVVCAPSSSCSQPPATAEKPKRHPTRRRYSIGRSFDWGSQAELDSARRESEPTGSDAQTALFGDSAVIRDEGLQRTGSGRLAPLSTAPADSEDPTLVQGIAQRRSYEAPIEFVGGDASGEGRLPRNPRGRTGLEGRGALAMWGPNHACETIITRFHPSGVDSLPSMEEPLSAAGTQQRGMVARSMTTMGLCGSEPSLPITAASADEPTGRDSRRVSSSTRMRAGGSLARFGGVLPSRRRLHASLPEAPPPRDDTWSMPSLQVLAFVEPDPSGTGERYRVPCYFDEPSFVSAHVRAQLLNEVLHEHTGDQEMTERVTHLLDGVFAGTSAQEVYRGYLDDPRNTDNAWIEMTSYHHHFSRELGGLLPFGHELCRAKWVSISDPKLEITDSEWFKIVKKFVNVEFSRPCLLQLVVRWGRADIVHEVLQDSELKDQRRQTEVQRALQDALERAMETSFDAQSVVETLMENGAEPACIFLPDLFRNQHNDSFGFCTELRQGKTWVKKGMITKLMSCVIGDRPAVTSTPGATAANGHSATASAWQDQHVQLMLSLPVQGFDDYATNQKVVRPLDLMCWAVLVGALDLAHLMWQRTRSPLRAGLIAEWMCDRVLKTKNMCEKELGEKIKQFSKGTVGVLDHLSNREEARSLLTGKYGEFATLGSKGERKIDILELAIDLGNRTFVAHRHCQRILDEQWHGRASQCGALKFGTTTLFELNDLSPWYMDHQARHRQIAGLADITKPPEPSLSCWRKMFEVWRIPMVKQCVQIISMLGFVLSFCTVCFQPLCGPIHGSHIFFLVYLACQTVQELQQWLVDRLLYRSDAFNYVDVTVIVLLWISSGLRFSLVDDGESLFRFFGVDERRAHESVIELVRDVSDPTGNWSRPLLDPTGNLLPRELADDCEVTWPILAPSYHLCD